MICVKLKAEPRLRNSILQLTNQQTDRDQDTFNLTHY
jgi:hypothetical protein